MCNRRHLVPYICYVLILAHCVTVSLQTGLAPGTLVLTPENTKSIEYVRTGENVVSQDSNGKFSNSIVTNIATYTADHVIALICENVTLYTDGQQYLFTANHDMWKIARQLHVGDTLLRDDGFQTTIHDIEHLIGQYRIYAITVNDTHTICISSDHILAHNECATASTLAMGASSGTPIAAVNPVVAGGIAIGVAGYLTYSFFKKRKNKKDQESGSPPVTAASGGADDPDGPRGPWNRNNNDFSNDPLNNDTNTQNKREKVLPKEKSYEQARNKALEIIGDVDPHTSRPHVGRLGVGEGKIVGRRWHGFSVIMRVDWDPVKGPHINIRDSRIAKKMQEKCIAIPFEGNKNTVQAIIKSLQK